VVAAHAQLGKVDPVEPLGPGGLEVAEQQDEVGPVSRDELRDRPVRRLVGKPEDEQVR
jgi:hypothetical protein